MVHSGDKVKVITKEEIVEGIYLPSPHTDAIIIKLSNGYNRGFKRTEVTDIEVLESAKEEKSSQKKVEKNPELPTIAILHTGGTIASKVDYRTGGVVSRFNPAELVSLYPELKNIANFESELIAQMWSDDLRFAHFSLLAEHIKKAVDKGVKGIIVGMGTDNMAVASAALSFIVEQSPVPIILLGSQRSSDRGSADAGMNLICAAKFIVQTDFGGVALCMHASPHDDICAILPGTKSYKLHASRRDAFQPVNSSALFHVSYPEGKVTQVAQHYLKKSNKLIIKPEMEDKVGLLKIHVHMFPEQFSFYKGYKGLILEGTGLGATPGQMPNDLCKIHEGIYPALKELVDSGCVVVMTSQCLFGRVNCHVYSKGRDLLDIGILSGEDMLANTAFVKLSWLLANYPQEKVKELIGKDLRGEISRTLPYDEKQLPPFN